MLQNTILKRIVLLLALSSLLQADFFVIPVSKKVKNLVTVAKSGGQFSDIQTAIDSIDDANSTNPYVVYIAPGTYSVTSPIVMQRYVSIAGSGKDATFIEGRISSSSYDVNAATIVGASDSSITNLYIKNFGDDVNNITIGYFADSLYGNAVENVKIYVMGKTCTGIYNKASYTQINLADVFGLSYLNVSYGIYNTSESHVDIQNSIVTIAQKNFPGTGIRNSYSDTVINNVTVDVSTLDDATGVYSYNSDPVITNSKIKAVGGGEYDGFGISSGYSSALIRTSVIEGSTDAIHGGKASLCTIIGGGSTHALYSDVAACSMSVDETGATVGSDCN